MADNDREQEKPGDILGIGDTTPSETDDLAKAPPRRANDEGSTSVNDEDPVEEQRRRTMERAVGDPARHDNPRTGKISDW
jgi:hypothetical protein